MGNKVIGTTQDEMRRVLLADDDNRSERALELAKKIAHEIDVKLLAFINVNLAKKGVQLFTYMAEFNFIMNKTELSLERKLLDLEKSPNMYFLWGIILELQDVVLEYPELFEDLSDDNNQLGGAENLKNHKKAFRDIAQFHDLNYFDVITESYVYFKQNAEYKTFLYSFILNVYKLLAHLLINHDLRVSGVVDSVAEAA